MYDPELSRIVDAALARLHAGMAEAAPFMAPRVAAWMRDAGRERVEPAERFKHPESFPMLLLPWWLESALRPAPDPSFQEDLVFSTLNGYLFIRLIDNVMDGHSTVEPGLLPALALFHTGFEAPYHRTFEPGHAFWPIFRSVWFASADATVEDASSTHIGHEAFVRVAARKTCAVKIPLAAVCYRCGRPDLMAPWWQFADWRQIREGVRVRAIHGVTSSMRCTASSAFRCTSAGTETSGASFARASRNFASVVSFMWGHTASRVTG